jgi:hypothetical protein
MGRPPPSKEDTEDLVDESRTPPLPSPLYLSTIRDLFRKYDKYVNQDISYPEYKHMMEKAGLEVMPEEGFANMCQELGSETSGLDIKAFIGFILRLTMQLTEERMYPVLRSWGYDESLYSFEERPFILTVHSET